MSSWLYRFLPPGPAAALLLFAGCLAMKQPIAHLQPPEPSEFPVKHKHHGIVRVDPWHWLRERDDPRVLEHLHAENAWTESVMAGTSSLQEKLFAELVGRIEQDSISAPYPKGDYIYRSRISAGQEYRVYERCLRSGAEENWSVYFDANREAQGSPYFDLGFLDVSPDGRILAYATDIGGEESYTLRFRDLDTGKDLPWVVDAVTADGEWDATGTAFYFIREDETRRPYQTYRYILGADPDSATLVHEEPDPLYYVGIDKSQDGQWLFCISESKETTEVRAAPAHDPAASFSVLFPRIEGVEYWVEHYQGSWLVRTDAAAPDFRLLQVPVGAGMEAAVELLPAREGVRLEAVLPLRGHLVVFERSAGLDRVRVIDTATGAAHLVRFPDAVYDLQAGANEEYATTRIRLNYASPIRPARTYAYDLESREFTLLRETQVPSGHDPGQYTTYRVTARSHDGVEVPMTIVHARDLPMDGSRPAYLHGYGAYGDTVEADFRTTWLTWLERGFTVAIAHVRGGGLLGEQWYQDGKLDKKQNTFLDFIACAETLIAKGYTTPQGLVIEGGSAGGLLIGAVLNERPDLFRAAVAAVPFVDVVNTMLDPSLPLTTFEYEEWGNPEDPDFFKAILAYSPYDNVRAAAYPALLVTAGYNDPRVPYWEAAKWVARLRKHQQGAAPILLKTNLETGHMGASGRYSYLRETALEQAFLLWQLGLSERD